MPFEVLFLKLPSVPQIVRWFRSAEVDLDSRGVSTDHKMSIKPEFPQGVVSVGFIHDCTIDLDANTTRMRGVLNLDRMILRRIDDP